jgi:hypothetical protein
VRGYAPSWEEAVLVLALDDLRLPRYLICILRTHISRVHSCDVMQAIHLSKNTASALFELYVRYQLSLYSRPRVYTQLALCYSSNVSNLYNSVWICIVDN